MLHNEKTFLGNLQVTITFIHITWLDLAWLDGAEVSASGWGSGGPRFQSHPRLTFQSCSHYQLNQLGSKAASESTFKKSNSCGVSNNRLYFTLTNKCSVIHIWFGKVWYLGMEVRLGDKVLGDKGVKETERVCWHAEGFEDEHAM